MPVYSSRIMLRVRRHAAAGPKEKKMKLTTLIITGLGIAVLGVLLSAPSWAV